MDIFSLGCVIAELFLEGEPLFTLSQLLQYRNGLYDPAASINKVSFLLLEQRRYTLVDLILSVVVLLISLSLCSLRDVDLRSSTN